jgi:hypothetical protein
MSISETTLDRVIDAGDRLDAEVRRVGRRAQAMHATGPGRMAGALGWFGIGLGLAEALAPRTMARLTGTEGYERVVFLFGLREIAAGLGILAGNRAPAFWLWARTAGDVLDLALLGAAAAANEDARGRIAIAAGAVAGAMAADIACAQRLKSEARGG